MDIGLLMPPSGSPAAQTNSGLSSETGQCQEPIQCRAFSVVLEDAVKNTLDENPAPFSDAVDPIKSVLQQTMEDSATGAALIGIAVASPFQVGNLPEAVSPVTDKAGSSQQSTGCNLLNADSIPSPLPGVMAPQGAVSPRDASAPAQGATGGSPQGSESIPLPFPEVTVMAPQGAVSPGDALTTAQGAIKVGSQGSESNTLIPQGPTDAVLDGDSIVGNVSVPAGLLQAKTADSSPNSFLQPAIVPAQSNEPSTTQGDSRSPGQPATRNGGSAPTNGASVLLEQPSGDALLPNVQPSDSLTSDRRATVVMNEQWSRNISPAASVNGVVQLSGRTSIEVGPSAILQAQGVQETTLSGQAPAVSMVGSSGGQDPFGASAQGGGEGALFQLSAGGPPESMARGPQSQLFSDQFTLAQQPQPSSQGGGSSVPMPMLNQLKIAQAFSGENQMTSMTPLSGMAQTVHVELPSHDSGPLSVRISMTDQTVSTQFTTDRSDLGQFLLTRQDQLQQSLSRAGLELGQFQVHINQDGRQETLPDRQSRRNGEAPEQRFASQDQNRQSHDQERPSHRPTGALSLFA
ncbi:MAG: hypothetical protein HOP22_05060 [Nitrospiraceae bacterium]|nr:hypothetical protein [Nitrospiraceae bacterium]